MRACKGERERERGAERTACAHLGYADDGARALIHGGHPDSLEPQRYVIGTMLPLPSFPFPFSFSFSFSFSFPLAFGTLLLGCVIRNGEV